MEHRLLVARLLQEKRHDFPTDPVEAFQLPRPFCPAAPCPIACLMLALARRPLLVQRHYAMKKRSSVEPVGWPGRVTGVADNNLQRVVVGN